MDNADRKKFISQLVGLQQIYRPDKTLTPEVIETYWQVFRDWHYKDFMRACQRLLKSKTISTFPLPGEIVEAGKNPLEGLAAWDYVRRMVFRYGPYMHVTFEDQAMHKCIELLGGWIKFCDCPDSERVWMKKEFERLYELIGGQSTIKNDVPLLGLHDDIPDNHVRIPAQNSQDLIE